MPNNLIISECPSQDPAVQQLWETVYGPSAGRSPVPPGPNSSVASNPVLKVGVFPATTPTTVAGSSSVGSGGPDPVWDAAANGIICDGVTDQITQLQALVDQIGALYQPTTAAPNAGQGSRTLWLPGFVAISSPLIIRPNSHASHSHGLRIAGPGRVSAGLIQLTSNTPIIQTGGELIHNVQLENIGLMFKNAQSTAQTNAYGISFSATGGTGLGWFLWTLRNLQITGARVGIGIQGTGLNPIWGHVWDDISFEKISHRLIDLTSPTAVGMPTMNWRKIYHINGGVAIGDSHAIAINGAEVSCDGMDIEDWSNAILYVSGGGSCAIRAMHVERLTGTAPNIFDINNFGPTILETLTISGTIDASAGQNLFSAQSGGRLIIDGVVTNLTITTPANYKTLRADGTSKLWVRNITYNTGTVVSLFPVDATTLAATIEDGNVMSSVQVVGDSTLGSSTAPTSNARLMVVQATAPTVGSPGAGVSAQSVIAGSTNTALQVQATLTAVAPGVVIGVVTFNGAPLASAPRNVVCSLSAPTAGVAAPPIVGADTYTASGFTIRSYGPTTVTTGTYIITCWVTF